LGIHLFNNKIRRASSETLIDFIIIPRKMLHRPWLALWPSRQRVIYLYKSSNSILPRKDIKVAGIAWHRMALHGNHARR